MKIGVIGLGLIGGSILKALYKLGHTMYAVSKSSYLDCSCYCSKSSSDISILKDVELVFVCSEIEKVNSVLENLNRVISGNTIVCDVASVKAGLKTKNLNYNFISSHPMAGSEKTGFLNSSEDLFNGCTWIIERDNEVLKNIIISIGANPLVLSNDKQDRACALISHLPLLTSISLFNLARKDEIALSLASSGFRDTTRLAAGSTKMSEDILNYNSKNIDEALNELINELKNLKNMPNNERMILLEEIKNQRQNMYNKDGKNVRSYIQ